MKRLASAIAIATLTLPLPAAAMPNAFWIFGFDVPMSHAIRSSSDIARERTARWLNETKPCSTIGRCEEPDTIVQSEAFYARLHRRQAIDPAAPILLCCVAVRQFGEPISP